MAKLKVKGTVLSLGSGTTYTPVAQIRSFGVDGMETETYESRTIDGTAGIEYDPTGYVEGGSTTFDLLHDPALAGHQAITDLVTTPAACVWEVEFADTGTTNCGFTSAGVGFGFTGAMNDGLKADVNLKLTGLLSYST
jgi:hypothetical protein